MKGTKVAELAINAIAKGPKWTPALAQGIYVDSYRTVPFTVREDWYR